jgi:3-deoxy-D-manno-octulosonic-acid transferase
MVDVTADAFLGAYRLLGRALLPLLPVVLSIRAAQGKEDRNRMFERLGHASLPRPTGRLAWIHAASVGETNSVIPLIGRVLATGTSVLLTSATMSSARIAGERLPENALHQYAPLDIVPVLRRFLRHWRPNLALLVESEVWPTTMAELATAGVPLVVVNGRLSHRSFDRWARSRHFAKRVFAATALCLTQTRADADRYAALGVRDVRVSGNLKFDLPPLAADAHDLDTLRGMLGKRATFVAASTHDGEEVAVAEAHRSLRRRLPDLLTIIVPRYPERGPAIAAALGQRGLKVARRAAGEKPDADVDVYLADTFGELGLFFRLAKVAFLGGSWVARGGQNPLEAARLETVVLHGPNVHNFVEIYDALDRAGLAEKVADPGELAAAVAAVFADPAAARRRVSGAAAALAPFSGALEATMQALTPFLAGGAVRAPTT